MYHYILVSRAVKCIQDSFRYGWYKLVFQNNHLAENGCPQPLTPLHKKKSRQFDSYTIFFLSKSILPIVLDKKKYSKQ